MSVHGTPERKKDSDRGPAKDFLCLEIVTKCGEHKEKGGRETALPVCTQHESKVKGKIDTETKKEKN